MTGTVLLANAFCVSSADWQSLTQGRMIVVIPWNFLHPGQSFALYSRKDSSPYTKFWARCELCKSIDNLVHLDALSEITVWTKQSLESSFQKRDFFFLAFLRVYEISKPIEVMTEIEGEFLPLIEPTMISNSFPVLNDVDFQRRKQQLEELQPSPYPQLEELLDQLAVLDLASRKLEQDIKVFLGWSNSERVPQADPDTSWIKSIAAVGNSSDGDLFEKLVRRSFVKLGFKNSNLNLQASLDPDSCGGAGGLDFYCEEPYPVVGECKATKTDAVPDSTPAQLVKLGLKHLQEQYEDCIKIIVAAGALNSHAQQTAIGNRMNVIRPETLQRLVELKAKYDGAINLLDLKLCLEVDPFGEDADIKLNNFINQVLREIRVRFHIIEAIEQLTETDPDRKQFEVVEIRTQYNASFAKIDGGALDNQTVHEILIEMSSPLTGYLGRIKTTSLQSDRFYFLRPMPEIIEQ